MRCVIGCFVRVDGESKEKLCLFADGERIEGNFDYGDSKGGHNAARAILSCFFDSDTVEKHVGSFFRERFATIAKYSAFRIEKNDIDLSGSDERISA